MGDYFDPRKLTQVPFQDEIIGPLSIIFLIVFSAGFVAALALALRPPARIKAHPLYLRLVQRFANAFAWVFGIGLVLFGFRALGVPQFLAIRLWLYLAALAALALAVYVFYYWRARFPAQLEAYNAQQLKRQYQQARRRRPVNPDGTEVPRSARAEKRRQRTGARGR
jgi:hypothetical protein